MELDAWNGTDELEKMLGKIPADVVRVDFDESILDYHAFAAGLNKSLPEDMVISLGIYGEPLMHPFFCKFANLLERPWMVRTWGFGPGFACLRANAHLFADKCMGITAIFRENERAGFIPWLRKVALLARVGYNIKIETPVEFNPQWIMNVTHGLVDLNIEVVKPTVLARGYKPSLLHSCEGALACISVDGDYYPCWWCLGANPLGVPVYRYGRLGEMFVRRGKKDCKLKECPLNDNE